LEVRPDLIITDVLMPRMNGLEFLGFVNQNESQVGVPVIVLTSQNDENTFLQALKLNIVAFLPKPFQPESLMEILRDVVPRQYFLED
ncbi:MAG: response regulator, partial [Chlorobi bacterium]|nr:response regulator [Chlorobiota bacterium]